MKQYKFGLEPYKGKLSRYNCPSCGKRKFTRYIDTETGEHLAPDVGKCSRLDNCGYHKTPKQYFAEGGMKTILPQFKTIQVIKKKPVNFIPPEPFKDSLKAYDRNNFFTFLQNEFGTEIANESVSKYFIGTSKKWSGATIFWQIDIDGRIRDGKIMLYNSLNCKRVKEPYNHIDWVHTKTDTSNFQHCFYGEHLLKGNNMTVAIVESEKTAVIASIFRPDFVWLASGGKLGLTPDKCKVLKGRTIVLFPDLKAFEEWTEKAKEISKIAKVTVDDCLEKIASETERNEGLDIADFLLQKELNLL
jgi:hypothetical protein